MWELGQVTELLCVAIFSYKKNRDNTGMYFIGLLGGLTEIIQVNSTVLGHCNPSRNVSCYSKDGKVDHWYTYKV